MSAEQGKSGRIILHIGRNKAGSTTIQGFCAAHRDDLAKQNIAYLLFGHVAAQQPEQPGFGTFEELAAFARGYPDQTCLISNEFMFAWPEDYTEATRRALEGCDVRVIAYLRPYDDWLCSAYAEVTRQGMNARDIDAYLEDLRPQISARPALDVWGRHFGWERVRVRAMDPLSLIGGDLLSDFLAAIGASSLPPTYPRENISPHWLVLELIRRAAVRNADEPWQGADREAVEPLALLMENFSHGVATVPYLTPLQRAELVSLYDADLARLAGVTGPQFVARQTQAYPDRPFVPALDRAPRPVLEALFEAAATDDFRARHPRSAAFAERLKRDLPGV